MIGTFHVIRGKVLYQDVCRDHEFLEKSFPFPVFQIQSDSPLVGVAGKEKKTLFRMWFVAGKRGIKPQGVTLRRFNFDDIGPHVSEKFGTVSTFAVGKV